MCILVCGVLVGGGLSAGSSADVATIQRRGRLTLTLTKIRPSIWSDLASDDGSDEENVKKRTALKIKVNHCYEMDTVAQIQ